MSSRPITNGTTYRVRPVMQPSYSSLSTPFISAGSIQLLVGPASAGSTEQMNVRSSTRETSVGSEVARKLLVLAVSLVSVPASTMASVSSVHSVSLPSQTRTASGVVSATTSSIQACSRGWLVQRGAAEGPA